MLTRERFYLPTAAPDALLDKAQDAFSVDLIETGGARCACCGNTAAINRRAFRRGWVSCLQEMVRTDGVTSRRLAVVSGCRDYPFLGHFGLAVTAKRGRWVITHAGVEFLAGRLAIPRAIYEFRGRRLRELDEYDVYIAQVRADSFDLGDLNRVPEPAF